MKLTSLLMKNFRQFYGEATEIKFSTNPKQNVTVIHGGNGAGKTAVLNAFTWALYGVFTPGFQRTNQLVNKRALREAADGDLVIASVAIRFEHEGDKYFIEREHSERKNGDSSVIAGSKELLQYCGSDGEWKKHDDPEDVIGRILPKDLYPYFFFDGERIEKLAQQGKKEREEIAKATKMILGAEVLVRAERHLDKVRKDFEQELARVGDPETKRTIEAKQQSEEELNSLVQNIDAIDADILTWEEQQKEIARRLRELEDVSKLQQNREELERRKSSVRTSMEQNKFAVKEQISTGGYSVFLGDIVRQFTVLSGELRARGELPAGIKKQFVNDLLTREFCICDTSLESGTTERAKVEGWLEKAGIADVEEKLIKMGGAVEQLIGSIPSYFSTLDRLQKMKAKDRESLSKIEDGLEKIHEQLKSSPREEISGLEHRLSDISDKKDEANRKRGRTEQEIRVLQERIDRFDVAILKYKSFEAKHSLAQRRINACIDASARIREICVRLESQFRKELELKIQKLFEEMSPTPYVPELTDDYHLQLLESAGGASAMVAASTGESQILSLSFIGSIIEVTRQLAADKKQLPMASSGTYPIVMDSPFGSLDPNYRRQIADNIPKLADQVVVLVSSTQWRNEVEDSMNPVAPKQYVLTYYTPKEGVEEIDVIINGKTWPSVKRSPNNFEYTEICEVTNG